MKQRLQRLQLASLEIIAVVLGLLYTVGLIAVGVQMGAVEVAAIFGPPFFVTLGSAVALLLGKRSLARAFQIVIGIGFLLFSLGILGFTVICSDRTNPEFWSTLSLGVVAFLLAVLHNACGHAIKRQMDAEG